MNKLIIPFVLLISMSCRIDKKQSLKAKDIAKLEIPKISISTVENNVKTITDELYTLQFKIEKTENNKHNLVIDIKLHNGSHFISPNATRDFKGKFYMDLGSYKDLSFNGNIIEIPRSVEENDSHPFTNGLVNWVRVNTTYTQPLNIQSEDDFEVFGRIRFTIEPRCTLEEIPFAISYKNGVMILIDPKC